MKTTIKFICNDRVISTNIHPAVSLLDFIRKQEHLTGTKEGCREGDCGACTVLLGELKGNEVIYKNVNSCLLPIGDVAGKHVVTIEGLNSDVLSPIQESFISETATQCGFCTPGFIVSLTSFVLNTNHFTFDSAVESIAGNICRCTGHISIKRAVSKMLTFIDPVFNGNRIEDLINKNFLPKYFLEIPVKLKGLSSETYEGKAVNSPEFVISGGTDLFVQKWEELIKTEVSFIPPSGDKEKIRVSGNFVIIKANTTITEFKESEIINKHFPALNEKLKLFGSLPIRNRATLGGNIINASPIGDMVNILLALDTKMYFIKDNGVRELPLNKFYLAYKTLDKQKDEILDEISIPIPAEDCLFNYEKVSKRTYLDIASVNSSILLAVHNGIINKINISAGGIAPVPKLLAQTGEFLLFKKISTDNVSEAIKIAMQEINPISDARGSADYKKLLLKQLIIAHFVTLFPDFVSIEELV
ncbi:MAG: FAD binding domain-containing protein [Bacteroidota bacterium]|nr:FAD binding domain-containing protein [Bacteroidota bacterium]